MHFKLGLVDWIEIGEFTINRHNNIMVFKGKNNVLVWFGKRDNLDWSKRIIHTISQSRKNTCPKDQKIRERTGWMRKLNN
ncbi:hypothetical protein ACFO4P_11120 [Epilithonimonas pallida]|uniref:Gelsolin-like domain-containing protein n=1 Tax=Epilithonimonas pallida TaxID=373671 RepID=A0ABY1RB13_9FLAO|nr:hypothetical protein [Epilithonimonas pallida]SMP97639.1 hypothetical protein SAMN05421679_1212 [Epilithonimonas pallida]